MEFSLDKYPGPFPQLPAVNGISSEFCNLTIHIVEAVPENGVCAGADWKKHGLCGRAETSTEFLNVLCHFLGCCSSDHF